MALRNHRFGQSCRPTQEDLFGLNRKRFQLIYTDPRFPYLVSIFESLYQEDVTLKNQEILTAYYQFSDQMQSNTFAIGELEFAIVAQICAYRPQLSEPLLERPILSVIYSYGHEIGVEEVLFFVQNRLLQPDVEPYGGLPNAKGMQWLEDLSQQRELLEKVFQKVLTEVRKEMEEG